MYLLSISFAIFVVNNTLIRYISSCKYGDLFYSLFMKNLPYATTPYFQEVGGVTQPLISHQRQNTYS